MHPRFPRSVQVSLTAVAVLASLLGAACSNNDEASGVPGIYALSRINGFPPPLTFTPGDGHTYVVSRGFVDLQANGAFNGEITGTRDGILFAFFVDAGNWTQTGSQITFNSNDPAVPDYTAQLNGSTLSGSQVIEGATVSVTFQK